MALNRVNADSIADGTVIASDIADGTITLAKLQSGLLPSAIANSAAAYANAAFATANSGSTSDFTNISITSDTYGNASYYPIITVSANGRVNTVTTQVVTGIDAHPFFFTAMGS
jgi:hypothetical protein